MWFRKKPKPRDMRQFYYRMAYFMLPELFFFDTQKTISEFTKTEHPAGAYLYLLACHFQKVEGEVEEAEQFQVHNGQLADGYDYHVLQFPVPPPVDMSKKDAILCPHFSAIVHRSEMGEAFYYILGQRPFGGTTLRRTFNSGTNANLGEGPPPELRAFLDALRQKVQEA